MAARPARPASSLQLSVAIARFSSASPTSKALKGQVGTATIRTKDTSAGSCPTPAITATTHVARWLAVAYAITTTAGVAKSSCRRRVAIPRPGAIRRRSRAVAKPAQRSGYGRVWPPPFPRTALHDRTPRVRTKRTSPQRTVPKPTLIAVRTTSARTGPGLSAQRRVLTRRTAEITLIQTGRSPELTRPSTASQPATPPTDGTTARFSPPPQKLLITKTKLLPAFSPRSPAG